MFFTRIGNIIAHFAFWFGAFRVGAGLLIAFGTEDMETNRFLSDRYLATETTGEAISQGMLLIVLGVALGVLCEINSRRSGNTDES